MTETARRGDPATGRNLTEEKLKEIEAALVATDKGDWYDCAAISFLDEPDGCPFCALFQGAHNWLAELVTEVRRLQDAQVQRKPECDCCGNELGNTYYADAPFMDGGIKRRGTICAFCRKLEEP